MKIILDGREVPEPPDPLLQYLGDNAPAFERERQAYDAARKKLREHLGALLSPSAEEWTALDELLSEIQRAGLAHALALLEYQLDDLQERIAALGGPADEETPTRVPFSKLDPVTACPAETARLSDAMASFWEAVLALGLPEAHLPDLQRSFRASLDAGIKLIGAMTRPAADELCERLEQTARDMRAGR